MTKHIKLIDCFSKVNDCYSITNCQNGFLIEVGGQDKNDNYNTVKYLFSSIDELKEAVQNLAWMPKN